MAVAGSVLFAFYAGLAAAAHSFGLGLPVVVAGSVLFVGVQYVVGKKLAQGGRHEDAPDVHGNMSAL